MKLKALLIDDEEHALFSLHKNIGQYCSNIKVEGIAKTIQETKKLLHPGIDVLFLDIQFPGFNGFELLELLPSHEASIVFVTAYEKYAIKAIKAGAMDYLLKPVDPEELRVLEERLLHFHQAKRVAHEQPPLSNQEVLDNLSKNRPAARIALPHAKGIKYVHLDEIIYLEGSRAYTYVYFADGSHFLASRHLGFFETLLAGQGFIRIHKSSLINKMHALEYQSHEGYQVLMSNGKALDVSRRRVKTLLEEMERKLPD